jgi:hypothetical protein
MMDKSKWNMPGALALLIFFCSFGTWLYVIITGKGGEQAVSYIIGNIQGIASMAAAYYFGYKKIQQDNNEVKK